ncbi:MAG: HAMP domain-containing sensor histidine kinase [Chloroflexota bacterium]
MIPRSIRWRLPLSYAGIALLATLALGAVLLTTLRGYYAMREHDNLMGNAQVVGEIVGRMYENNQPQDSISAQVNTMSFVSQARIRVLDLQNAVLADSGNPFDKQMVTFNYFDSQLADNSLPVEGPFLTRVEGQSGRPLAGFWVSGENQAFSVPALSAGQRADQFTISVASSPYGVGLRRDISLTMHSDQAVMFPMHDTQNNVLGMVEVSNGPAYGTEIIDGVIWALVGAGAAAVILAAGAGWFMSRTITAPLMLLSAATEKMADGQLSTRVQMSRSDEFGVLAHSFDEMAQRVEATVIALRRFVADAAHQIHTPLTAVHADLELAASEPNASQRVMFVERALVQLKRLEALTNDLLDLSRLEAHAVDERRGAVDLVALVREISESFASRAEQAGIAFNVETPTQAIKAQVNETQFRHAIGNLLDNAIKFTPENGTITLGVRCDGDQVELWVNDTGIGISAEDLPQIFNRFHRGRNAAPYPGSGLGLAIIKAIVEGHHGQISVQSKAGNGTRFALRVPAASAAAVA